jgi:hypothetical protein
MIVFMKLCTLLSGLAVLFCSALPLLACGNYGEAPSPVLIQVALHDGSTIKARAEEGHLPIQPTVGRNAILLKWDQIQHLDHDAETSLVTISFTNGDLLTGHWASPTLPVEAIFGQVDIPCAQVARISDVQAESTRVNIALGKPVFGQDGASHGKGLAKHLTDGDYDTHTKPPASHFCYRIDLRNGENNKFALDELKVHWRHFGDRFVGVRNADDTGWAPASWPGEYVTSYEIDYRPVSSEEWLPLHQWKGRPVDEKDDNVVVDSVPSESAGCSSEVTTTIRNLGLNEVAEIRISARGSHWIGLYEIEAFGPR